MNKQTIITSARETLRCGLCSTLRNECICFIAYKVYKELERIIRISKINLSVDKVLDIAKTIATIDIKTDRVEGVSKRTLFLTQEQMAIKPLFDLRSLLDD